MKADYNHNLGIAQLENENSRLRALTLLQQAGQKRPSLTAYLGARYSRSSDSIATIAAELEAAHADGAARLEKIFHGYGHASVGDMCPLSLCLENIPMATAMRFFYLNPVVLGGQERSSRYQLFSNSSWRSLNLVNTSNLSEDQLETFKRLSKQFDFIMQKQLEDYSSLLQPTQEVLADYFEIDQSNKQEVGALKARTFDVARQLLPMGLHTSLIGVMSARMWAEYISYMRASSQVVERELGEMLAQLLTGTEDLINQGYVPEADGLIRYASPNYRREDTVKSLISLFEEFRQGMATGESDIGFVSLNPHALTSLLSKIALLVDPSGCEDFTYGVGDIEKIGELIFTNHNHHNQLGTLGQSGAIVLQGFTDLGSLKDINRHRSLERFIPILENQIDMEIELNRKLVDSYRLCEYLDINYGPVEHLSHDYTGAIMTTYPLIKQWYSQAAELLGTEVATEYTRYLLPHAHRTAYQIYGSLDDLQYTISLRVRPGGHINYRLLVYEWLEMLALESPMWNALLKRISKPDPASTAEFIDRS